MAGVVELLQEQMWRISTGYPVGWQVNFKNGDTMKEPKHPLLLADKVRQVGDAVAMVIAETREQAVDAVQAIQVEYEELPVVINAAEAIKPGAQLVHDDIPNNICFDWQLGNSKEEVEEAISGAAHVTTLEFVNQRLIPNAIEPRSYIGSYDEVNEKYTFIYQHPKSPLDTVVDECFCIGYSGI